MNEIEERIKGLELATANIYENAITADKSVSLCLAYGTITQQYVIPNLEKEIDRLKEKLESGEVKP